MSRGAAPAVELVEETVSTPWRRLRLLRPRDAEELLDEDAFAVDEFLPYWAELWPAARALAVALGERELAGLRIVELGCGLALPALAAAAAGAEVLAVDWAPEALALVGRNARRNGLRVETLACSWAEPAPLLARAPFDLALAADVLYERRNVEPLLALLPRLADEAVVADPSRPYAGDFLARAAGKWRVETRPDPTTPRMRIHRLRRQLVP